MRVLFLSDNFPPETNAPAIRTWEHTRIWAEQGHDVTVVTCAPNFPSGKVHTGYRNRLLSIERREGVRLIRVFSVVAPNAGFIRRIVDFLSFAVSASIVGLFLPCDVIIATSPQFFTTWAAALLGALKRKPWVFELRDLWPESIYSVGAMNRGAAYRLLERVELGLYRNARLVVAVTEAFRENLVRRGISRRKVAVVPNGVSIERDTDAERVRRLRSALGLEDAFVVGYLGTHGMAHGLDFVVRAAASIGHPDIVFVFVGDGAEKDRVVALADELGATNCRFLEPVPRDEVPTYLAMFDVALINLRKSETFTTVLPSKIFEAAGAGRPMLVGVAGEAKRLVERYGAGVCFEPENESEFTQALDRIRGDAKLVESLIAGCERLAKDYNRRELAMRMLTSIEGVI